jgi:drug/metabolite transporter (DMT)-like permease
MRKWLFFCLLSLPINGVWAMTMSPASKLMSPVLMQVLMTAGYLPAILVYLLSPGFRRGTNPWLGAAFGFSAGLMACFANVATAAAMKEGGEASTVTTLTSMYPLITVMVARILLRERPNGVQWLGVALALGALFLYNMPEGGVQGLSSLGPVWMAYALLALGLNGLGAIPLKLATKVASTELSGLSFSLAYVAFAGIAFFSRDLTKDIRALPGMGWFYGAVLAVLGGASLLVMLPAYRHGKASVVTALTSLYPAVTVALAIPILGESLDVRKGAAVLLALGAGVMLSHERALEPAPCPKAEVSTTP